MSCDITTPAVDVGFVRPIEIGAAWALRFRLYEADKMTPKALGPSDIVEFVIWNRGYNLTFDDQNPTPNNSRVEIEDRGTAGTDPAVVLVTITDEDTALMPRGDYEWTLYALLGTQKWKVVQGNVHVETGPQ